MNRIPSVCLLAIVAVSAGLAASSSVSMPSFWRYARPEAKALVGIEWQQTVSSPLGQELRQKIAEQVPTELGDAQLMDRIGRIFISSPGNLQPGSEEPTPAVMAVQGNFDLSQIRAMAAPHTTGTSEYQSVEILHYQEEADGPTALALVSPQLVLAGDESSVVSAIDHYLAGDPGQASNPLFLRVSELASTNDIWIVSDASPSSFSKQEFGQAQFLNDVESVEAGLSFQSSLGIKLNLGTNSAQSATELATGLQLMLGMMLASHSNETGGPNLADKLMIGTDDTLVRMAR